MASWGSWAFSIQAIFSARHNYQHATSVSQLPAPSTTLPTDICVLLVGVHWHCSYKATDDDFMVKAIFLIPATSLELSVGHSFHGFCDHTPLMIQVFLSPFLFFIIFMGPSLCAPYITLISWYAKIPLCLWSVCFWYSKCMLNCPIHSQVSAIAHLFPRWYQQNPIHFLCASSVIPFKSPRLSWRYK